MAAINAKGKTDVGSRIKEAETYYSMGLLDESLGVYEELISAISDDDAGNREAIQEKIDLLREEVKAKDKKLARTASSADISMIKETLSIEENLTEILDSAIAFKELGLFREAIAQYEKTLDFDYSFSKVVPELAGCLLELHSPREVITRIDEIIGNRNLDNQETAQTKYLLGLEVEKRGHNELALDQYKIALDFDPEHKEIKNRVNLMRAGISSGSKYDYLLSNNIVSAEQLQQALVTSKKINKSVEYVLINNLKVNRDDVAASLSGYYGCPFRSFDPALPIPVELIRNLKKAFLLHDLWVPLSWERNEVEILIDDPNDLRKTGQIKGLIKTNKIILSVGIKEDIVQFISHFFDRKVEEPVEDMIEELEMIPDIAFEEEDEEEELEEEFMDESSSQVVKFVDQVVVAARRMNASDIHIEPSPITKNTQVRIRMDGVCHEYAKVPNSMARGIISRLKIMGNLDIAERRLPQDGKVKFKRKGIPGFEMRLATMPTTGGFEDAVLRLLAKAGAMKIDEMGFNQRDLDAILRVIQQPYGLILVVGPTGSGKTTTLHACVGHINKPSVKIWTAEDPVEITQAGLRQVEVNPKIGLDFARVMRSFLRADPDIILIGEMRDYETASTGIEASLTGHLVFSTLHTNNAPETVTRLLDMGLNPINFSDSFRGVLAQRLVRRLCEKCREQYHPSQEEFDDLAAEYGKDQFETTGIEFSQELTLYRAVGCEVCANTGYKGRIGIFEMVEGTPEIKRLIKQQATSEEIGAQATKEGTATLKQDGIRKVFSGITDISEVRRVCIN